jgi:ribonuclease HI
MDNPLFPEMIPHPAKDETRDTPRRANPDVTGWFVAHCDGGSRGNPGPAGYGAVIEDPQGRIVARLSEYLGKQTNNYAEYAALLAVLDWAVKNEAKRLRVVSDSELMVKQMKGLYKVKNPGLVPLWEEAKRRAAKLTKLEMSHTLRGGNKEADQLANDAMDKGTGRPAAGRPSADPATPSVSKKLTSKGANDQILEGYVKGGVVHLLEGDLPDGTFVKITRK